MEGVDNGLVLIDRAMEEVLAGFYTEVGKVANIDRKGTDSLTAPMDDVTV